MTGLSTLTQPSALCTLPGRSVQRSRSPNWLNLDLRLLVDRENDGMGGWIDIEPDDVTQLVNELRVVGELELLHPMRLKAVSAPDALDRAGTDADCFAIKLAVQWVVS